MRHETPAELAAQTILDLEAKGQLPPGVRVVRDGDLIQRIEGSWGNTGESDVEGLDLRARLDWKTDLGDMAFDLRWSHVTEDESRVAGEKVPGDFPRDRVHGSLRVRRGALAGAPSIGKHAIPRIFRVRRLRRLCRVAESGGRAPPIHPF